MYAAKPGRGRPCRDFSSMVTPAASPATFPDDCARKPLPGIRRVEAQGWSSLRKLALGKLDQAGEIFLGAHRDIGKHRLSATPAWLRPNIIVE